MKTKEKVAGYKYSHGSGGKKWQRGNIVFSEGRKYIGNNDYVNVIVKTNLDTGKIELASLKEAKRFLTEEGYKEYMLGRFMEIAKEA